MEKQLVAALERLLAMLRQNANSKVQQDAILEAEALIQRYRDAQDH
jgi:hypothetical protein